MYTLPIERSVVTNRINTAIQAALLYSILGYCGNAFADIITKDGAL